MLYFYYYFLLFFIIFFNPKSHTIKALCRKTDKSEHERQKLTSLSNVKNSYYNKRNTDLHFQYCWFGPEFKGTSPTTQNTKNKQLLNIKCVISMPSIPPKCLPLVSKTDVLREFNYSHFTG